MNQFAIPKTNPWYTAYSPYSYNPRRAAELLAAAGVQRPENRHVGDQGVPGDRHRRPGDRLPTRRRSAITVKPREVDFATVAGQAGQGRIRHADARLARQPGPRGLLLRPAPLRGRLQLPEVLATPRWTGCWTRPRRRPARRPARSSTRRRPGGSSTTPSYIYLYNPDIVQGWAPTVKGYKVRSDRAVRFRDVRLARLMLAR